MSLDGICTRLNIKMWMRHDTPSNIASILARHAPKVTRSILDPSAGSGVLIKPFLKKSTTTRIECVDIDSNATDSLKVLFEPHRLVRVISSDFLVWSSEIGKGKSKRFDCVIMNPPFAARKISLVNLSVPSGKLASVPIEAAFVYRSVSLLKQGGRILAILPASIVSGGSSEWLRKFLLETGAIRLVHELPPRTFSGIEGRMYMLVYVKGKKQKQLSIYNHRLIQPDKLTVAIKSLTKCKRMDFAFHEARMWFTSIHKSKTLNWNKLGAIVSIYRGAESSPVDVGRVLHTTNLRAGKDLPIARKGLIDKNRLALKGDIVMMRVGRNCATSPMVYQGIGPIRCSDCVFILRPNSSASSSLILFGLRVIVSWNKGANLIEQGVGATYITMESLRDLEIPTNLFSQFPVVFARYEEALKHEHWEELLKIEKSVRTALNRRADAKTNS